MGSATKRTSQYPAVMRANVTPAAKACIFCRSIDSEIVEHCRGEHAVHCNECHAEGPLSDSPADAVLVWNRPPRAFVAIAREEVDVAAVRMRGVVADLE